MRRRGKKCFGSCNKNTKYDYTGYTLVDLRNFLFSYRSFTPIPIAVTIIYFSHPVLPYLYIGLGLIFIGELTRINAVRYAGGVTRTMKVGAPSLCTAGPYSITRNPLYFGNMIIYCGIVFTAGGVHMWQLLFLTFIYFTFQYSMIISLEEERLKQQNSAELAAELIARTEILHDEIKNNYEFQRINAERIQESERQKLSKYIKEAQKEVINLIKKLKDQGANGEDSRLFGIRLKEIETEHLTKKNIKSFS